MAETGLSAPEAFVLSSLPHYDIRQTLKLGFMGLLAQGILRSEEETRPGVLRARRIVHLRVAPDAPAVLPPIAASLVTVVRAAAQPRDGLIGDIVKQAMREYGRTLTGFVQKHVGPALVERGLAEMRRRRFLGVFPSVALYRTSAGDAEKTRLENALHEARAIPQYLDRDPAQAAALAAAAGSAILMVEELRPHYQQLAEAFRLRAGDGFDIPANFDGGLSFDFGTIDLGSFDSFGAGFDGAAGGSDGGGDGGGSGC